MSNDKKHIPDLMLAKRNLESNDLLRQEILKNELVQNQITAEQNNVTVKQPRLVPQWMRSALTLTLKFTGRDKKLDEKEQQSFNKSFMRFLNELQKNKLIKGFLETQNGFRIILDGGKYIDMDLRNNTITLTNFNLKTFRLAAQLVRATGSKGIDISNLKEDKHRFFAWKSALEKGLDVAGLKPGEENKFKEKLSEKMSLSKTR